jgi:hypothetical protein
VGNPGPQHRHAAHDEGDVCRHGDAPARFGGLTGLKREVDPGRDDHASERCGDRQGCAPDVPQLAEHNLALHLEADDEEKDRHQAVVNPVLEGVADPELADLEAEGNLPDTQEAVGEGRVGQRQGRRREEQQHDPTGRLDVQEPREGRHQAVDRRLGKLGSSLVVHSLAPGTPRLSGQSSLRLAEESTGL